MNKTRKNPSCRLKKITLKTFRKRPHDISKLKYSVPESQDLAICFIYFNVVNSKRLLMNYLYTVEKLKMANIPYFTVEIYTKQPEIANAFHIQTDFILFQKERYCHVLEKAIPNTYTKLLFLDADIIFENPNWYNELSKKLETFDIVQPFTTGYYLDITYKNMTQTSSKLSMVYSKQGSTRYKYHPGFGWAFKRCWFQKYGFFQQSVIGGGDRISSYSWIKPMTILKIAPKYIQPALKIYLDNLREKPSICNISGSVYHLWHGSRSKRQYKIRENILGNIDDIRTILSEEKSGIYTIKNKTYRRKIKTYLFNRDDDGQESNT
jgi:hypothetical protein